MDTLHSPSLETAQHPTPEAINPGQMGILVVDDDLQILALLRAFLRRRDWGVWIAPNGREALEIYDQHYANIAGVLLDIGMPEMDGPATLRGLKAMNPRVRVTFMGSYVDKYERDDLLKMGAIDILPKPFHLEELRKYLAQMLSA